MHSLAQHLQSQGRGNDSMLVHMTPREVGGLQALAQAHGGTLTRNPTTGLPEAGFLDDMLPMIVGAILTPLTGGIINPFTASLLVGGGTALATGDIEKGLMAGLSAYGGAGLGSALGLGANSFGLANTFGNAAVAGGEAGLAAAQGAQGMFGAVPWAETAAAGAPATGVAGALDKIVGTSGAPGAAAVPNAASVTVPGVSQATTAGGPGRLGLQALDIPKTTMKIGTPAVPGVPGSGLSNLSTMQIASAALPLLSAMEPSGTTVAPKEDKPTVSLSPPERLNRQVSFTPFDYKTPGQRSSVERQNFTPVGGSPSTITRLDPTITLARGGNVNLEDGSFVVDARTVSELGNGSSNAGQELLARMGGRPIRGPGDGVSDSIHANIGGRQEARVARDEVKFSPDAVKRVGGGSAEKGAQRLYALMHKAQQARKKAKRGEDTNLRGLMALRNAT
jgi:hypothetical protein